jgi:Xaa-Pro aminopeptidase
MIQNFDVQGGPQMGRNNLPLLRESLARADLDGFLIPHEDEYQNEYLPDCNERLMWASGFTGSAGAAVVLPDIAAIFVDGRYTLQVKSQVSEELFSFERLENSGVANWLKAHVKPKQRIGYDPKLHTPAALRRLRAAVSAAGGELRAVETNPIDHAWTDRPAPPKTQLTVQPLSLAGESHESKRMRIGKLISGQGADAALITSPASIAWLLNIRGGDVMCTPLPLSTVIIDKAGQVLLFIHPDKLTDKIRSHLGNKVTIQAEDAIGSALAALKGRKIIVDPNTASAFYADALQDAGAELISKADPIALPKALKNQAEITATTQAHLRDGAALAEFLHWLDTEAQSGHYDEIQAAQKLEGFRAKTGVLRDLSFESISGAGANGAIVHYRVSRATTAKLAPDTLYLIDSGGQYVDGTTDVTRTVPIGTPSAEMRERFTLVLKGHLALARVRFPKGTTGSNLDALARMALWAKGLDYDHGTGHGVGVFLGVHEGPQRISKAPNSVTLEPGMIVSNEPGYYKTGAYGIRIENLQYVTPPSPIAGGDRDMMGFQTLTYAPIHHALIAPEMLSETEIRDLNEYHANVWEKIGPRLSGKVKIWLKAACEPINSG